MSIGGEVIEIIEIKPSMAWINTYDGHSECAIYCDPTKLPYSEKIQLGDILWWQSGIAYWTSKEKHLKEIPLKKIGFSGISQRQDILRKL